MRHNRRQRRCYRIEDAYNITKKYIPDKREEQRATPLVYSVTLRSIIFTLPYKRENGGALSSMLVAMTVQEQVEQCTATYGPSRVQTKTA